MNSASPSAFGVVRSLATLALISALALSSTLLTACGGGSSGGSTPEAAVDASTTPAADADTGTDTGTETTPTESEVVVDVDEEGNTTVDSDALTTALDAIALGELSDEELTGLLLMREEEKLARDVYIALYDLHGLNVFNNISNSEQTHTDAVLALLERYDIADPVGTNELGVFTDQDLQMLYDTLVAAGTPSLMDALFVGAKIEELDIADIERLKNEVVDNDDIVLVYDNLLMGSRNHLRAFDKQITNNGWTYEPEFITQEQYDEIVTSDTERGPNGG